MVRDLDAVLARLGGEHCVLCALSDGVPIALQYTVLHPERISHLVLIDGYTKGSDFLDTPAGQLELGIRDKDWTLYTETLARLFWGFDDSTLGEQLAEHIRACVEPDALRAAYDAVNYRWDVTDLLPSVSVPTLVLHNKDLAWLPLRSGQRLAAAIPNARFLAIEDRVYSGVQEAITQFLNLPSSKDDKPTSGTAIILFADIADSTALTERLGDDAFRDKARSLDEAMRAAIRSNGGTPVEGKTLGDGVLAVFTSAHQAITCAQACHAAATDAGLALHAGIHAGDVIREKDNVYGGAVNIAARVAAASAPGETLVSATVRDLARTSAGVSFEDRGEQALKGIDDPVRVFAVTSR
jgi:class 3 adenylate cyclase